MHRLWKKKFMKILSPETSRGSEIDPDEIFLDSSNLPHFDTNQFEGRMEKPLSQRTFLFVSITFLLVGFVFLGKLWALQVTNGDSFGIKSENNSLKHTVIFANRGLVLDRNGEQLAYNGLNPDGDFSLRHYANTEGLSHLVGYIKYPSLDSSGFYYDDKYHGKSGVESSYDEHLSGRNGLKIIEIDALGNLQSESVLDPPKDGKNVKLAVDSKLNEKFFNFIKQTAQDRGFRGGAGAIMDIKTGELLSLTSYPEFSSEILTQGKDKTAINGFIEDKNNPFINRAVSGLYTPGSIIKPFIATGVLEENIINPLKQILSTGSISIPNPYDRTKSSIFKDWKAHGWVDLRHALAVSSDVYFYAVGGGFEDQQGLGISKINDYIKTFGFGFETGIDIEGEVVGNVPNPEWKEKTFEDGNWRLGDTYNSSIGQYGFQITVIQSVRAVASIANGGYLLAPTVRQLEKDEEIEYNKLPFDGDNLQIIREGMRLAVTEGTASGLNIQGLEIAAKTGTAELGVAKNFVNSWSIGYFPYKNPRYAFAVVMESGSSSNTIGATFVIRQLFDWMKINTPQYLE